MDTDYVYNLNQVWFPINSCYLLAKVMGCTIPEAAYMIMDGDVTLDGQVIKDHCHKFFSMEELRGKIIIITDLDLKYRLI